MCNLFSVQFSQNGNFHYCCSRLFYVHLQSCSKWKWLKIELQGRCLLRTLVTTDSARVKSKLDTTGGGATHPTGRHSHNQQAASTRDKTITKGTAVLVREQLCHCAIRAKGKPADFQRTAWRGRSDDTRSDKPWRTLYMQNISHVTASCRPSGPTVCHCLTAGHVSCF